MIPIDPFLVKHYDAGFQNNQLALYFEEEDKIVRVPHIIELCWNCNGEGRHLQTSLRNIAFSSEDQDYDPDFMEEMREGFYDERCDTCQGQGRLIMIDEELCDKEILKDIELTVETIHEMNMESEMERRMGC